MYTVELLVNVLRQMVREPRHICLLFPFIIKVCWHIYMYFTRQWVLVCVYYTFTQTHTLPLPSESKPLYFRLSKIRANVRRWGQKSTYI